MSGCSVPWSRHPSGKDCFNRNGRVYGMRNTSWYGPIFGDVLLMISIHITDFSWRKLIYWLCRMLSIKDSSSELSQWNWLLILLLWPSSSKNTSVRLSVRLSVRPSVTSIIMLHVLSWNFQELLPKTEVMSMQKVKVRGQSPSSQKSKPNLAVSGLLTRKDLHMMMKWCTELDVAQERSPIVFNVIRQISRSHG